MTKWTALALALAAGLAASAGAARAEDGGLRDLCPDRPGLDTPPCIVDKGRLLVELGGVDWTRDRDADTRTDTIVAGDALVRYGLTDTLEALVDLPVFGTVRTRDRQTGEVSRRSGIGDLSLGLKQNLLDPTGQGVSLAVAPFVTAPTGGRAIGGGAWAGGVQLPVNLPLTDDLAILATPEIDASANEDRHGRHLAYGTAAGLSYKVTEAVTATIEGSAFRDRDPDGHETTALASTTIAWQPTHDLQLDAGAVAGLNHVSPDLELYVGLSRRF